jgi:hypothetical protein
LNEDGSKTSWFALIVYCRWCWSPSVSVAEYRKGIKRNEGEQLGDDGIEHVESKKQKQTHKTKPRVDIVPTSSNKVLSTKQRCAPVGV